ncbi:hypothetical protein EDD64_1561 [Effusibacillus lacus]|nr:hypothetical protein EDD64_1561 [Effusibacillus lacus]
MLQKRKMPSVLLARDPESIPQTYMIRIVSLGRTCKNYLRLHGKGQPNLYIHCPHCHRIMNKHGCYKRTVATKHQAIQVPIYRWYCTECRKTLTVLPDFLIPWARFATTVRESAIVRRLQGLSLSQIIQGVASFAVGISAATVKRWWKRHLCQVNRVSLYMAGKLVERGTTQDLFHLYPRGVNPALADTAHWLRSLVQVYASYFSHGMYPLRGYWCWLNTQLPHTDLL